MPRTENYCNGRLVKEIERVNTRGPDTNFRDVYIDGPWQWRLDGEEISDAEAEAFRTRWQAEQVG